MGFHFTDRAPPFGTDRAAPPVLVYTTTGSYNPDPGEAHDPAHDDDLILAGVEFIVEGDREQTPPNIFDDDEATLSLSVTEAEGWHFDPGLGITALHAWIHRANPEGVFHPTNPTVE